MLQTLVIITSSRGSCLASFVTVLHALLTMPRKEGKEGETQRHASRHSPDSESQERTHSWQSKQQKHLKPSSSSLKPVG